MSTLDKTESVEVTNGEAWAAILASGIGCLALGILIALGEDTKFFGNALNFYNPSGNLSGKTTVAIVVWLIAWGVLHAKWKSKTIANPGGIAVATVVMVCLGIAIGSPFVFALLLGG